MSVCWFTRLGLVAALLGGPALFAGQSSPPRSFYTTDLQAPVGSREHPARVSSGVMMGNSINRPHPVFGKIPCGVSGVTVMRALINPEGKVEQAEIISGAEALRKPWLDAVKQWTYKPYTLDGKTAWVEITITNDVQFGRCDPDN